VNPAAWVGCGFVATAANASPDVVADMGVIRTMCPQIAFGFGYPENDPVLAATKELYDRAIFRGLGCAGWAWCCFPDRPDEEAEFHAQVVRDLGLTMFVCNMEEPYDAHGDSSNELMWAPDYYADAFRDACPDVEFGITTTPRWGSSGNQMRAVGATMMPQAFTGEVPSATIPACVDHAKSWGWTLDRIRPLVQVYKTNELRPDAGVYNADALAYGVGVIPYILEQAFDGEGVEMIRTLTPSIERPPAAGAGTTPPPVEEVGEPPPVEAIKPPTGHAPDLPFVRALYPPDAHDKGKTPSDDGPDVEAVKRAVSRAGYWKWQTFDQAYSNAFAHGGSSGPGLEGFQHDHVDLQGKPPSGWYGSASHEALRTYVLPDGPNAGQYAFDQRACDLYRQASDAP
jgi:hypothetical protein